MSCLFRTRTRRRSPMTSLHHARSAQLSLSQGPRPPPPLSGAGAPELAQMISASNHVQPRSV